MKGNRKKHATIFKLGNKLAKGKQCNNLISGNNEANSVQYVRPSPEEADLVDQNPLQPLVIKPEGKPDKPVKTYKMLQSIKPKRVDITKQGQTATYIRLSVEGYRLFHTRKLWDMVNNVVKQHKSHRSQPCDGNLGFDHSKEEKWGSCWRERVICDLCSYASSMLRLYEEIKFKRRGRKAATANVGLSISLTQTPAGPRSLVKLYASCNIPPPARQGLQKRANSVSKVIEETNISDMQAQRQQLKTTTVSQ